MYHNSVNVCMCLVFFFQAEDGIRDIGVTGVQTCALPIYKEAITERVLSDLGPCVRCPILDLDTTAEIVARLPERIEPGKDAAWRYKEDGPLTSWAVVKTRDGREAAEATAQDDREGLIERLARSVRSSGAGVAA